MQNKQGWEVGLLMVEAFIVAAALWSWPVGVGCAIGAAILTLALPAAGYALGVAAGIGWGWLGYQMSGPPTAVALGAVGVLLNIASVMAMTNARVTTGSPP